jgi:hypothetical protein
MSYCQPAKIYLGIAVALLIITLIAKPDVHIGLLTAQLVSVCICFTFLLGLCELLPALAWAFIILLAIALFAIIMGKINVEDYIFVNQDDYIKLSNMVNDYPQRGYQQQPTPPVVNDQNNDEQQGM